MAPQALRGAREACLAGTRRQAADLLERADALSPGRGGRGAGARRLSRRGPRLRRLPARRAAGRAGPPAPQLEGRRGAPERLPRGPRIPARGAPYALRVELRAALVRLRPPDGRLDDRALRRLRAGWLLRDLVRPRAATRPPQGPRGQPDPCRQLERRLRPAAPGRAHRRAPLRAPRRVGVAPAARAGAAPPAGLCPPAPGARLPRGHDAR